MLWCCWPSVLLLTIINQGQGVLKLGVSEVMAVSRDLALAKPIISPFVTCPATPADLQGFLTLLWPGKQA